MTLLYLALTALAVGVAYRVGHRNGRADGWQGGVRVGYERGARETLENVKTDADRAEFNRLAAIRANRSAGARKAWDTRKGKADPDRPAAVLAREFPLPETTP